MMPDCSILTNHGQSRAPAVVCDGCYRLAITSIQEGENEIDALENRLFAEQQATGRAELGREKAEARAAELESLIADHEFEAEEYDTLEGRRISVCPVCGGHGGHHTHGLNQPCPWGQAAANHRARTEASEPQP